MRIRIVDSLKIKDKYVKEAIQEYSKRLTAYCKIEYVEAKNPAKEISGRTYVINIAKQGELLSSEQLAQKIEQLGVNSDSDITVVIGAKDIDADYEWCISPLDIERNLLLIIIYEQIYRAFRIINNAPYHK